MCKISYKNEIKLTNQIGIKIPKKQEPIHHQYIEPKPFLKQKKETLCSKYNNGCPNCIEGEIFDDFYIPPRSMQYDEHTANSNQRDAWIFTYKEANIFSADSDEEFDFLFENVIELNIDLPNKNSNK